MEKKLNVLVVEDEKSMGEILKVCLEEENYNASLAIDGQQAIESAKKIKFDLLLMDIKLPGMNGVETFRQIKKSSPGIKVIMMTAYIDDNLIREAIREGVYATLYKPFEIEKMFYIIDEAIENRTVLMVDDRAEDREIFKRLLEEENYRVTTADNGFTAINLIKEKGYSIVFIDIKMPDLDGVETLRRVKEINPNLSVVMTTGYSDEELVKECLKLFAHTCLYKPLDLKKILKIIEEVRTCPKKS